MRKRLQLSLLFVALFTATSASAHTAMSQLSIAHIGLHVTASIGIYIAMMLAGLYLLKRLPKLKKQEIKVRVKK